MTHCALACTYICAHTPPRPRSTALHLCQFSHLHPNSVRHRQAYRDCHSPRPRSPGCRLSSFVCVSLWAVASVPGPGGVPFLSVCLSVSLFFRCIFADVSHQCGCPRAMQKIHLPPSTAPNESAAFPRICIVYRAISQRRLGLGLGLSIVFFFVTYRLVGADTRTGIRGMRLPPFMPVPAHRPTVPPHRPRALIADRLCPQPSGVHIGTQTLRLTYRIRPGPVPLTGNPNASPLPPPPGM